MRHQRWAIGLMMIGWVAGCATSEPRAGDDPAGYRDADGNRRLHSTYEGLPRTDTVTRDAEGRVTSHSTEIRWP